MSLAGEIKVKVSYGKQMVDNFTLFVVEGDGPSLMGRDVLQKIKLDWSSICTITGPNKPQRILDKFSDVFEEGLGEMNTFTGSLQLKPGATSHFVKARPVPFALKQAIEQELDRLEEAGIVEKVTHSKWASPVVVATLAGGKQFTKIDLTNAYQQMVLDQESRELVTINLTAGTQERYSPPSCCQAPKMGTNPSSIHVYHGVQTDTTAC